MRSYVSVQNPSDVREHFGTGISHIASVVPDLKEVWSDVAPTDQDDDPDTARFKLFDAFSSFLQRASQGPPAATGA